MATTPKVTAVSAERYRAMVRAGENENFADPEQFASAARFVERDWGDSGYRMAHIANGVFLVRHSDGSRFLVHSDRYGNTSVIQGPEAGQSRRRRTATRKTPLTSMFAPRRRRS